MFDLWSDNEILCHFVPQNDSALLLVTDFVNTLSRPVFRTAHTNNYIQI